MLSEAQLKLRETGVCGSEIGAVAELSPFEGPLDVFNRKLHLVPAFAGNEHTERGDYLEPAIAQWGAAKLGATDVQAPGTLVDPKDPLIIATPDRVALWRGERVVFEIKAPAKFGYEWGKAGTADIPEYVLAQVHWELRVTGLRRAVVLAFAEGELRHYVIERDGELEAMLVADAHAFWAHHIVTGVPPEKSPSGPHGHLAWDSLCAEDQAVVAQWRQAYATAKAAETTVKDLTTQVQRLVGGATGLHTPYGRIDWKRNKPGTRTDWESAILSFRQTVNLYASTKPELLPLREALDQEIASHTTPTEGARPFKPYFTKEAA